MTSTELCRSRLPLEDSNRLRDAVRMTLERVRAGKPTKSILMTSFYGVEKTILLDQMREEAESSWIQALRIDAVKNQSFPAMFVLQLQNALITLSRNEKSKEMALRALRALARFVIAMKGKYPDIEFSLEYELEPGLADNGDLEIDLADLLEVTAIAAQKANTAMALFIDEFQYVCM